VFLRCETPEDRSRSTIGAVSSNPAVNAPPENCVAQKQYPAKYPSQENDADSVAGQLSDFIALKCQPQVGEFGDRKASYQYCRYGCKTGQSDSELFPFHFRSRLGRPSFELILSRQYIPSYNYRTWFLRRRSNSDRRISRRRPASSYRRCSSGVSGTTASTCKCRPPASTATNVRYAELTCSLVSTI
jgi:hypothetical protein